MSILRFTLQALIVLGMATSPLPAQQNDVAQAAENGSRSAEGLVKAAEKSRSGLADIAAEAALNHLEEPPAAPLERFSEQLQQIGRKQVAPVQQAFKVADATTGDSPRRDALVDAFARQKVLELALKEAAAEFSPGEVQLRLVRQIAILLGRQMNNLRQTSGLAASTTELTGSARRRLTVAGLEQSAMQLEIALLARTVARHPSDWPDGGPVVTAKVIREKIESSKLLPASRRATESTRSGQLMVAVADQQSVEVKLSELLDAALEATPADLLGFDAKKLLTEIIADERELRKATAEAATDNPTPAERQKRIEERTEVLKRLLTRVNPEAAAAAGRAGEKMKAAGSGLAPGSHPGGAVPAESEAIALLEKANGLLPGVGMGEGGGGGEGGSRGGRGQMDGQEDTDDPDRGRNSEEKHAAQAIGKLVAKEREAFAKPDEEGSLPEYSTLVEQYLRSLTEPPPLR
jgi:hypothetical protein